MGNKIQKTKKIQKKRQEDDRKGRYLSEDKSYYENIIFQDSHIRDFPIGFHEKSDSHILTFMGKSHTGWPNMRDLNKELTRRALKKQARIHYISHDHRISVWIWHQIIFIEVSGRWDPEIAKVHLDRLFDDFTYVRKHWTKAFSIVDLRRFEIQTVAFRAIVKNYWAKFFNRNDLMIYFVENNALRRAIRAAMLQLITQSHNVHLCKDYKEISRLILPRIREDEVEIRK